MSVQVVNPANLQVISFTPGLSGGGEGGDPSVFLGFWGTTIELLGLNLELPGGTWTIPYLSVINGDIYTSVGPWFEKSQLVQVTNTADYEMYPVWSPRARTSEGRQLTSVVICNGKGGKARKRSCQGERFWV